MHASTPPKGTEEAHGDASSNPGAATATQPGVHTLIASEMCAGEQTGHEQPQASAQAGTGAESAESTAAVSGAVAALEQLRRACKLAAPAAASALGSSTASALHVQESAVAVRAAARKGPDAMSMLVSGGALQLLLGQLQDTSMPLAVRGAVADALFVLCHNNVSARQLLLLDTRTPKQQQQQDEGQGQSGKPTAQASSAPEHASSGPASALAECLVQALKECREALVGGHGLTHGSAAGPVAGPAAGISGVSAAGEGVLRLIIALSSSVACLAPLIKAGLLPTLASLAACVRLPAVQSRTSTSSSASSAAKPAPDSSAFSPSHSDTAEAMASLPIEAGASDSANANSVNIGSGIGALSLACSALHLAASLAGTEALAASCLRAGFPRLAVSLLSPPTQQDSVSTSSDHGSNADTQKPDKRWEKQQQKELMQQHAPSASQDTQLAQGVPAAGMAPSQVLYCLDIITALAGTGPRARAALLEAGAAPVLTRLLQYRNLSVLCAVCDATTNLSLSYTPGQLAMAGSVQPLARCLASRHPPLMLRAARALGALLLGRAEAGAAACEAGVIKMLIPWLEHGQPQPLTRAALGTLANLCCDSPSATARAVRAGLLPPLLAIINAPPGAAGQALQGTLTHGLQRPAAESAARVRSSAGQASVAAGVDGVPAAGPAAAAGTARQGAVAASAEVYERALHLVMNLVHGGPAKDGADDDLSNADAGLPSHADSAETSSTHNSTSNIPETLHAAGAIRSIVAALTLPITPGMASAAAGALSNLMSASAEAKAAALRLGADGALIRLLLKGSMRTPHVLRRAAGCLAVLLAGNPALQLRLAAHASAPSLPAPAAADKDGEIGEGIVEYAMSQSGGEAVGHHEAAASSSDQAGEVQGSDYEDDQSAPSGTSNALAARLVSLMRSPLPQLAAASARCVGAWAYGCEEAGEVMGQAGALQALTSTLSLQHTAAVSAALTACAQLMETTNPHASTSTSTSPPPTTTALSSPSTSPSSSAAVAAAGLPAASLQSTTERAASTSGVAARNTQRWLAAGGGAHAARLLAVRGDALACRAAHCVWAAAHSGGAEAQTALAQAGVLPALAACLQMRDWYQPRPAAAGGQAAGAGGSGGIAGSGSRLDKVLLALQAMVEGHRPNQLAAASSGCIPPLAALLDTKHEPAQGVWRCCAAVWAELGGPSALTQLLSHKQPCVVERAAALLEAHARDPTLNTPAAAGRLARAGTLAALLAAARRKELPPAALERCLAAIIALAAIPGSPCRGLLVEAGALHTLQGLMGHRRPGLARLAAQANTVLCRQTA